VDIAIENLSDLLMERLRQRAAQRDRSIEVEARVILEEALGDSGSGLGPNALLSELRKLGVRTRTSSTD
jgi:plasmid stability protein